MKLRHAILAGTTLVLAGMSAAEIQLRDAKQRHAIEEQSKPYPLPPHVAVAVVSQQLRGDQQYEVRMGFANTTAAPIYYRGDSDAVPDFEIDEWNGREWHMPGRGWQAVVGLTEREHMLPAGGAVEFIAVRFLGSLPFRIAIPYRRAPGLQAEPPFRARTDRIDPPEHKKRGTSARGAIRP